jgi:sulfoxide reductase heme-binding subunit YedZ
VSQDQENRLDTAAGHSGKESWLKSARFNDWSLFYFIAAINSIAVIGYVPTQDLTTPLGLSEMIQCSVRVCVPILFVAFAASSCAQLAPSPFSRWLLRNRRSFGLAFAAGMGWQMVFILGLLFGHPEYYAENVFSGVSDFIIYRLGPYLFMTAMVISSFHPIRRKMNRRLWRAVHWSGIYYLWWVVEITYYDEVTVYDDRQIIDYIYVVMGAAAFLARATAWTQTKTKRWRAKARRSSRDSATA